MGNHFDYLVTDDAQTFFHKVAIADAGVKANAVAPEAMQKIASAQSPLEKVAARLDRDLEMLKVAGDCGINAGMMRRADAYIDVLLAHNELQVDELEQVFDKVAAHAIQTDLLAAYEQLCDGLPESEHDIVDDVLIKIGRELTEFALMEKEARFGLGGLRGLRGAETFAGAAKAERQVGKLGLVGGTRAGMGAASEVIGSGARATGRAISESAKTVGRGAKAVGKTIGEGASAVGRTAMKPVRAIQKWRRDSIMSAPDRVSKALEQSRAAAGAGGLRGTAARGAAKNLEKQLPRAEAKRTATLARESKLPARPFAKTEEAAKTAPAAQAKEKAIRAESGRQEGAERAREAARPPGEPPKSPPKADAPSSGGGGGEPSRAPAPPGGAEGKPPGFMDAWRKATTKGWKSLSEEERGSLIRGGVTAALVYRAATGKGAVTGNEGVI